MAALTLISPLDFAPPLLPERDGLWDSHGRRIIDLRVSITDRCNYRCVYCRDDFHTPFGEMPIADYMRMIRVMVGLGIEKVRLTGGEPLLRNGLLDMVHELAEMRTPSGSPLDIALTTNGHMLAKLAQPLKDAGLSRVTVSMDAADAETTERLTRVPGSYQHIVAGIRAAQAAGLGPVKVNCVVLRGFNDEQIEAFGRFARDENIILRFIEFMPLEEGRVWSPDVVVAESEILERLSRIMPLVPMGANHPSETARRYQFIDGVGEIGIIAPVSRPFCGACSRIRLTSDGKIRTCLFSQIEHDLAGVLRSGGTDDDMAAYIRGVVHGKEARHHIGDPGFLKPSRSMVHIGG